MCVCVCVCVCVWVCVRARVCMFQENGTPFLIIKNYNIGLNSVGLTTNMIPIVRIHWHTEVAFIIENLILSVGTSFQKHLTIQRNLLSCGD